jgi:hypothetical protein
MVDGGRWMVGEEKTAYLREGTVVPQVALVGEAVADVTELALLDILLDGVEELLLGDLQCGELAMARLTPQGPRRDSAAW